MKRRLSFCVRLPVKAEVAYAWHEHSSAFNRLSPAWDRTEMLSTQGIREGGQAVIALPAPWGRLLWTAEHFDVRRGREFSDRQLSGPFYSWLHRHSFAALTEHTCELHDDLEYELPLSPLSDVVAGWFVRSQLSRMFAYRQRILCNDLSFWQSLSATNRSAAQTVEGNRPMRILLTGSGGMIGKELAAFLSMGGHQVIGLSRQGRDPQTNVQWDLTESSPINAAALLDGRPLDAVIHLAGEGIADKRWSAAQKQRLEKSRVQATENLIAGLAAMKLSPRVFISASGIGYYGDAGDTVLNESSPRGEGFLAELAERWEASSQKAAALLSARCVQLRMGAVLTARGGALQKMLLPFQLGLGGRLGNGRQWMSWVALDDVLYATAFALQNENISGPVNLVSPEHVTNAEFSKTLGRVLQRPAVLPAPSFALRVALGEMAEDLLLASQRAMPQALLDAGFAFRFARLEDALRHTLGRS